MNKREAIANLILAMNLDIRLQVHTYSEVDTDIWEHIDKTCPLCCAMYILELSTVEDLQ